MHSNEINKSLAQAINVIDDKNDRYTDLLDYAEAFFTKSPSENLYRHYFESSYRFNKSTNVYELIQSLDVPTGAITSLSPLNSPQDKLEVLRALEVTPLFIQAKHLFPQSPWIYYTSEKFIYIYPYVTSKEFKFTKEILKTEFYQNNLPQNNPEKKTIWTNPYFDLAGQGMMITKSKPIYIDNRFNGSISIDIKISDIYELINLNLFKDGVFYIVNQHGNLITSNQTEINNRHELTKIYDSAFLKNFKRKISNLKTNDKIIFFQTSTKNNFVVSYELNFYCFLFMILKSQYISLFVFIIGCLILFWWKREEKLVMKNEADNIQKNKLISLAEMSGGIAHEINNPLTVILGRANQTLKKMDHPAYTKKEIANNLEKIVFSAERISKIITTLKNFSRSDQSQPMQLVSLEKIISESLLLCENRIHNESTSLNIDLIPNIELHCHAYQIIQILINLINNSFDATSNLEERWIKISFEHDSHFVQIKITDSGSGIPKENFNKLFEPFFTTKPINFGTGLGLSISKKIALNHRGDLIYDTNNKNTCFILKLPLKS